MKKKSNITVQFQFDTLILIEHKGVRISVKHFISPTSGLTLCTRCIPFFPGVERKGNLVGSTAYRRLQCQLIGQKCECVHSTGFATVQLRKNAAPISDCSTATVPPKRGRVKLCTTKASTHGFHTKSWESSRDSGPNVSALHVPFAQRILGSVPE